MIYGAAVLVLGLLATPVSIALMRRAGVVDVPNDRSSHTRPTVRGAGTGVALVAIAALVVAGMTVSAELLLLALGAAAFAVLGLLDDLWELSALRRLPMQLLIGVVAVVGLGTVRPWYLLVLAVIAVVGYLNAFNFMDGINGISGLHALGIGATWVVAGLASGADDAVLLGAIIAAAAAAFLPYNFPRARGFLGDVGSYFFGGCIAVSAVALHGQLPVVVIVLPLSPYIADTVWTLLRRVRRGEKWHEAHREHVYQRLVISGWSHSQSALLMGVLTISCGAGGLLIAYVFESGIAALVVALALACILVVYLALPDLSDEVGQHKSVSSAS